MRRAKPFDHGRLADAGLAGQDRVVLPAAGEDVDDLADLEVAADDRVDLALLGPVGQVHGELIERRRLGVAGRPWAAVAARLRLPGDRRLLFLGRAADDRRQLVADVLRRDAASSGDELLSRTASDRSASRAASRCPDRSWAAPYSSEASTQASRIRSRISGDNAGTRALPVLKPVERLGQFAVHPAGVDAVMLEDRAAGRRPGISSSLSSQCSISTL